MANIINAITTGTGGLSTTADASGNINFQSGGSTVASITSSGLAVTGALTVNGSSPGRSGASAITLNSGTTNVTLTSSSNQLQVITADASGYSITLPDMTTLQKGNGYFVFYNTSSFAIALKDAGGTIREYLYPSKSGSPIAAVALNIEDTSTTNGIWHAHNPISAGIYPATTYSTFTAGYTGGLDAIVQCGPTYYVFLSRSGSTCYAKLGTLNLSTKTFTFGSSITLSGSVGTWAYNGGYGESNGVDKGILAEYWGVNPGGGAILYWGFAIVSGVLYVTGSTTAFSGNSATVGNAGGLLVYSGNDCFLGFNRSYTGYTNNNANAVGYKVTVSGTTVTLTAATGSNIAYAASGSNGVYWYGAYTSYTTLAVDQDGGANPRYVSYNTSTNTLSGGTRTAQTTMIAGNVMGMFDITSNLTKYILPNNAGTKILIAGGVTAITNPGTANLTATATTLKLKSYASSSYATVSTGFYLSAYYNVSSSSVTGYDGVNQYVLTIDPSNADFNINYCAVDLAGPDWGVYATGAAQFVGNRSGNTINVMAVGSPFIS